MESLHLNMDFIRRAPLDELLAAARERYEVAFEPLNVDGVALEILQVTNMEEYVDRLVAKASREEAVNLPFWAKIWPAAILLGYYLRRQPSEGRSLLELGGGVGVSGLVAAASGFETVITDIEPDALLFAQINVLHNDLAAKAEVRHLDCSVPPQGQAEQKGQARFDIVAGAEVLYREDMHRGLAKCLLRYLKPVEGAEAVLARSYLRKAESFFKLVEDDFHVQEKVVGMKSTGEDDEQERSLCAIARLAPRKVARKAT